MPSRLTYRHVETIRAVMLTGSITGAAARLHVTQPAISHLIHDIEDILQFPLFDRRLGRIVPTRRAELLLEEIERSFVGLDGINEFCTRLRESEHRSIVIAAVPVVSIAVLPAVIRDYRQSVHPDFFLVRSPPNEQVIAWVNSQKADIGIALDTVGVPGIRTEAIGRFQAMCLLPPGHRLANAETVSSADLRGDAMIATTRSNGLLDVMVNAFHAVGGAPTPVVECPAATAACAMVEAGVGFTLLDPVAAQPFRHSRIVFKRFEPSIPIVFCAYWVEAHRSGVEREPLLALLRERMEAIAAEFPEGAAAPAAPVPSSLPAARSGEGGGRVARRARSG
ncbi:LysR substrate-binding domain-containing protein [Variovorax sp. UMC13]|uniref:LysR substrate-binding domain-containing protein n=1 Tax=Variovorax sp. UMC13 TaxID=1862326 RepID=UPI001601A8DE|nr:LysR substrate-binding domain-containing protein [Variovorax sp. UMC13]MBB1598472.1 hypothetical protein [Variovorax sp. UMC13]